MVDPDPARDPLLGQVLNGAYRLTRLLSYGGMGRIYEAQHTRIPKRVAVKVVRRELLSDMVVFERFWREAHLAASLGNPHLVEAHDFDTLPDGTPYMVMEILEGEDLGQRLGRSARLSLEDAVEVLRQVVDGLSAAHRQGVVHRDLKPENLFMCRGPSGADLVKVLDFGASKIAGKRRLTADLTAVGTPWYMSPEQAQALPDVDARSDQYAIATVFFEMLAGRPPFEGATPLEVMNRIVYSPPPALSSLAPGLPWALDPVLARALAKNPAERYLDVDGFLAAVEAAPCLPVPMPTMPLELDGPVSIPPVALPVRRSQRLHRPAFALGLLAVLSAGAYLGVLLP